ncbi:transcription factor GTE11-like [Actinidia eriantha]|uniref:transcription factor GTE11-like n=1 Tax=Actinidia eriantha TaxID=165200 RepID=UPI002583C4FE|nr:transcription factor GTE11-like [Actinidia eriantha]
MGIKKRGLQVVEEGRKEKRRKMDRSVTQQCYKVLRELMTHPAGWVFNQPVDPVKLNIPDYSSVISEPMDLGTVNTKLASYMYSCVEELAADVRLTCSNAMLYNPSYNNVHNMAKEVDDIFNARWRSLEEKWNRGRTIVEQSMSSGSAKNTRNPVQNGDKTSSLQVGLLPKTLMSAEEKQKLWNCAHTNVKQRRMSAEEKQKLRKQILEVSRGKIPPHLQGLFKKIGFERLIEEKIELDVNAFAEEALIELKGIIGSFISARATKTTNGEQQLQRKIIHKRGADSGHRSASASAANVNPPLDLVLSSQQTHSHLLLVLVCLQKDHWDKLVLMLPEGYISLFFFMP